MNAIEKLKERLKIADTAIQVGIVGNSDPFSLDQAAWKAEMEMLAKGGNDPFGCEQIRQKLKELGRG